MAEVPHFTSEDIITPMQFSGQRSDAQRIQKIIERRQVLFDSESAYDTTVRKSQPEFYPQPNIGSENPNVFD